ncbi:MAG: dynamin family protein [Caldilineaceae bacterium]|nr:dynamin family protein [Caldilineaceae bacterium]
MQRILTKTQDDLLRRERALLEELRVHFARLDASDDDLALLKRSLQQLDELFLLVVVGEFNAGKSAFINALLGERILAEGVTPTTADIHVLRYGETFSQQPVGDDYLLISAPVEWLREISLVDTPGANAVIQRHQEITEEFVPRSDLVLFVTSADRPFSESERSFLERIRRWGKKIVIIVNKFDLIDEADDQQKILDFVGQNGRDLLGAEPTVFPISARMALKAKQKARETGATPGGDFWEESRFGPLENYILNVLDAGERVRLKLANPLGVAAKLVDQYQAVIDERQALLKGDFRTLDEIEAHLDAYERDMRHDYTYHVSHVDNVLYAMAERGDRFFDETMRIARVMDLVNGEKIRGQFEREVLGDTSREVERYVSDLIDWMVEKDYRQWRDVNAFIDSRASLHADKIMGQVKSDFEINRQALLTSIGREAREIVQSYDQEAESLKLAQDIQSAIIQTAAVEVGALGLGALMVALLQTTVLDVTGILAAGSLAALGFYVLPYRRSRVKKDLRNNIEELRTGLHAVLDSQFETELNNGLQRIRESIAPYTRFVRVEREKLERLNGELSDARRELEAIRQSVEQL